MRDRLDDGGKLLVELGDFFERGGVLRVLGDEWEELGAEGFVNRDADVVDCGFGVFVEVLVDADRVGEFDGREGAEVRGQVLVKVGDVTRVAADDLWVC